jgi:hypothetical protein
MAEEYAREIARKAVGQVLDVVGFDFAHGNALDAMADVMTKFVKEVGMYTKESMELQGRTDASILDVVRASRTECAVAY